MEENQIVTKKELCSRQYKLHEFFKKNSEWIHLKVILQVLADHYYENDECYEEETYLLSSAYIRLKRDIRAIRECDVIKRVLVTDKHLGAKYATKKEALIYFKKEWKTIDDKIKKIKKQQAYFNLDKQTVMQFTGNEKKIIESLIEVEQ